MSRADRVVVIGGTGFIGSHLVQLHLDSGSDVTAVSRSPAGRAAQPRLTCVRGESADEQCMQSVIERASIVYHLAAGGAKSWAGYERDFVHSTRVIAQACQDFGVKRLVYVSTSAALYLGEQRRITEADGHDPKPEARSYYSRAKIYAERVLMDLHAKTGFPMTILRPCLVVGRGGFLTHAGAGMWPTDTWCMSIGDGRHPLPWVLVQDVAQALFSAAYAPGIDGHSFNLAGDIRPSGREYVSWIAERSLRNIHFRPTSPARLYALALGRWMAKKAGGTEGRFPTYRDFKSAATVSDIDCSAAKRLLDWRPNAELDFFIREAIDSHLRPVHPHDLRLNPSPFGAMLG